MTEIIDFLLTRRSVTARNLTEPGPTEEQLDKILRAAHRVPDHGKLGPWRFIVLKGDSRAAFGEVLVAGGEQGLVVELAQGLARRGQGVVDVHHRRRRR